MRFSRRGLGSSLSNSIVAGNEAVGGSGGSTLAAPVYTDPAFGGGINNSFGTLNVSGCRSPAIGPSAGQVPRALAVVPSGEASAMTSRRR